MAGNKAELLRSIKFLLFSVSAGLVQIASFALLDEAMQLPHWLSYLVSLVLSVLWNFTLNRRFTFRSAGNLPLAMLLVALYYAVFTPLSTWWTAALTGDSIGWNEYIVLAGTMIINFATEYLFDRLVVFRRSINTAKTR